MITPPLALTLGDPDGIGPEIALKAWQHHQASTLRYAIHANPDHLSALAASLGIAAPVVIYAPREAQDAFVDGLPVLPLARAETAAEAALASIDAAVHASLTGTASGVVTNPISKAVMYEAGFKFPGHTEYLAHLSANAPLDGARGPVMMLAGGGLRCALVTIHQSLRSAAGSRCALPAK